MTGRFHSFFSSEQLVGEFEDESRAGTGADGVQGANADCQSEDYPAADGDGDAGGKPIREGGYCGLCYVHSTLYPAQTKKKSRCGNLRFRDRRRTRVNNGAVLCSPVTTTGFTPRSPHLAHLTSTPNILPLLHLSEGRRTGPCDALVQARYGHGDDSRDSGVSGQIGRDVARQSVRPRPPRGSEGRLPLRLLCDSGRFDGCRLLRSPLDGSGSVVIRRGWARGS